MRVPFGDKNINVPDEYIERQKLALGCTQAEAIELYLSDEGFVTNDEIIEMSKKAKEAGTGAKATSTPTKRKPPVRKPDEMKRALVAALAEFLNSEDHVENVNVTNIERMIAFSVGADNYELTLTKKRAPKK